MVEKPIIKVNLGSASHVKEGWINCDARGLTGVDRVFDLTDFPWPFDDLSIDMVASEETIEHLPHIAIENFFKECFRILKHGGTLFLQCPDIGKMCEMYTHNQVCDCVPQKALILKDFKANPNCYKCHGRALVNPTRWLLSFIGAQKHEFDTHRMIFTKEIMRTYLEKQGFININIREDLYKIKVTCRKL